MDWGGYSFGGGNSVFIVETINWQHIPQITGYFFDVESTRRWLKANGFVSERDMHDFHDSSALRVEFPPIFINAINSPIEMWLCVSPKRSTKHIQGDLRGVIAYVYELAKMEISANKPSPSPTADSDS